MPAASEWWAQQLRTDAAAPEGDAPLGGMLAWATAAMGVLIVDADQQLAMWVQFGVTRCGVITVGVVERGVSEHNLSVAQTLHMHALAAPWPGDSMVAVTPSQPATEPR